MKGLNQVFAWTLNAILQKGDPCMPRPCLGKKTDCKKGIGSMLGDRNVSALVMMILAYSYALHRKHQGFICCTSKHTLKA